MHFYCGRDPQESTQVETNCSQFYLHEIVLDIHNYKLIKAGRFQLSKQTLLYARTLIRDYVDPKNNEVKYTLIFFVFLGGSALLAMYLFCPNYW